jgi:signal transduction histidine kinase
LLEDTASPLRRLAEARGTQLSLLPCDDDCNLRADPVRIAQVVVNLVGNAIKFSDGSGEVTVWTTADADSCQIHVRDRGIGIAPVDQQRIFEDFSQVDSGHTRRFGGTGLGLSISKRLIELHGGRIWVDSELGAGSTFHVRLPRSGPAPSEPAPPRISARAGRSSLAHGSTEAP